MASQDPSTATPAKPVFDAESESRISICVLQSLEVLSRRPAGLLTDIDGTVSEMAPAPHLSFIDKGAMKSLEALALHLEVVGVVTGRGVDDARRLTGRPDLLHIGNHGYERKHGPVESFASGVQPYLPGIREAADAVISAQHVDPHLAGVVIENKRFTASFHYRLAADPDQALASIRRIVGPIAAAAGLKMSDGKMVVELKPPLSTSKGTAIKELIDDHRLKGVVFFGDDITDIDGFDSVRSHHLHTDYSGLAVSIVTPDSSPLVAAAADLRLHGVRECAEVLRRLAVRLENSGRQNASRA